MFPVALELPSTLETIQGGAWPAGPDLGPCSLPAQGQAPRVSCQAAGRGLGIGLMDWKLTHLPPD